jgi:hypothetical protein
VQELRRILLTLAVAVSLCGAGTASAQSKLEREFAQADANVVAALKKVMANCQNQAVKFWSYSAGQGCKEAVGAWRMTPDAISNFVADLGQASFLTSQESDTCQKRLQGGQDADKEKVFKLESCPNGQERLEVFEAQLKELKGLLATRP